MKRPTRENTWEDVEAVIDESSKGKLAHERMLIKNKLMKACRVYVTNDLYGESDMVRMADVFGVEWSRLKVVLPSNS